MRAWTDVNRGPPYYDAQLAYDSAEGRLAWDMFFAQLDQCIAGARSRRQQPLVIDVHGNSFPLLAGTVLPGTGDSQGSTLPAFLRGDGSSAYPNVWFQPVASGGLFSLLEANGILVDRKVFSNASLIGDYGPLLGGYIIRRAAWEEDANAVQFEFSYSYRSDMATAMDAGVRLARAVVAFGAGGGAGGGGWPPSRASFGAGVVDDSVRMDPDD